MTLKPYAKYWISPLIKVHHPEFPPINNTPLKCIELKIRAARVHLSSYFEKTSFHFQSEFSKPTWTQSASYALHAQDLLNQHINTLWSACIKDYIQLCSFEYLYGLTFSTGITTKKFSSATPAYSDAIAGALYDALVYFYENRESTKNALANLIDSSDEWLDSVVNRIKNTYVKLENFAHQMEIRGSLHHISLSGCTQYRYICENSESSCSMCAALHGRDFNLIEAKEGVNLPPMHPNCRCRIIAAPPLPEFPDIPGFLNPTILDDVIDVLERIFQANAIAFDNIANSITNIWNFFFRESFNDYYGTFTTIEIEGNSYWINKNTFQVVAIGPDGNFIVPEVVSPQDAHLLELMKLRDSLPINSNERRAIEIEIPKYRFEYKDKIEFNVDYRLPYDFYILGDDVTSKLDQYMRQTEVDYAYMHKRYWLENLLEFKNLVGNGCEMDLKNQPEWHHSAFIYNGEVIAQDALGNINYGYFGTYCNFPQSVLMAAAGFAQLIAGTHDWAYWTTFLDDPRDSYRIIQGIDIYEQWH